jgi:hypothetical protein
MRHAAAVATTQAGIEWERAPGQTRRLPWLLAGAEPEDSRTKRPQGRVARLLGRGAPHTASRL